MMKAEKMVIDEARRFMAEGTRHIRIQAGVPGYTVSVTSTSDPRGNVVRCDNSDRNSDADHG